MARQLCFFGIALLVFVAYWVEFLPGAWFVFLLVLLFLLWFPLRGQVELHIKDEINAIVYLLPLPFWRLPVFRITRPYHWWRTLGEDLEQLEEKKRSLRQKKNPVVKVSESPSSPAVSTQPEESTKPQSTKNTASSHSVSPQQIAKALEQIAVQKFQLHFTLGGSPMIAALAGGMLHSVVGWAATILRLHTQKFAEPDVVICLAPNAPWVQGHGVLRLKTDLLGVIVISIGFFTERRRIQNGRKGN